MAKSKGVSPVGMDDWQTEDDMRTLMRAKEIQADPKRMAKVKECAKGKLEALAMVMGEASES